jgi:ferrochelatase
VSGRPGVLLVNLGTPDAPTPAAVRRYLAEFLSDPRVVELPRWLWLPVLHGVILRVRPARSAALYRRIWTPGGSPLLVNSLALARALEARLSPHAGRPVPVELGMTYGAPRIDEAMDKLLERGAGRVVVLPLYPQYSASTTGSVFDRLAAALRRRRRVPGLTFVQDYHDQPGYVAAVAASVREFRAQHGAGERLLFSFHGLPARAVERGDPYLGQCRRTAELVAGALGLTADEWQVAFQSRVGREKWLEPYTDETIAAWGKQGMQELDVVCPGFAVDCLETLEEVALRYRELFRASGGGELRYVPALNARPDHVAFLAELLAAHGALPADAAARDAR